MDGKQSGQFRVRIRGSLACFTRPEMKVERVSYEVMTPSAARGVLEAILWKPAIRWQIHTIEVLAPIVWTSFRRNEVSSRMTARRTDYCADEDRAQRHTVALKDVDYVVSASFVLTDRSGNEDSVRKFEEMFARRLEKGQHFHQPYLGCREFAADVEPALTAPPSCHHGVDRPLGLLFYDFDRSDELVRPLFFEARLRDGVLHVPPHAQILAEHRVTQVRP